jgi:hypothetical protein
VSETQSTPSGNLSSAGAPLAPKTKLHVCWWIAVCLLFVFCLLAFTPGNVPSPKDELDASWVVVLNWAHVHHSEFGSQIVYTFGPWGFAAEGGSPDTYKDVFAAWLLITAAFCMGVATLGKRLSQNWPGIIWISAVAIFIAGAPGQFLDVRISSLCWLLLLVHFYADDRPWTIVKCTLTVAVALASLMKFTYGVMAMPVLIAISFEQIWRKKLPSMLILFLASFLGFWLAARQPLGGLGIFLSRSWMVASGYEQGEPISRPTETQDVSYYWSCAIFLLGVAVVYHWKLLPRRERKEIVGMDYLPPVTAEQAAIPRSLAALAGLSGVIFMLFKAGYVRHDVHEVIATGGLFLLALFCVAAWEQRLREYPSQPILYIMLFACLGLVWHSFPLSVGNGLVPSLAQGVANLADDVTFAAQWFHGSEGMRRRDADRIAALQSVQIPSFTGDVDVYPWGQQILLAHGLDYNPRPVFQSHLAYTTALATINRDFLAGPRAPKNILFDTETIDLRYPSEPDGLSWPLLLGNYDLANALGRYLLLQKTAQPRNVTLQPLLQTHGRFSEWVSVPDSDDPIWVSFHLHPTPMNSIMRTIYKGPTLLMGVRRSPTDAVQPFRVPVDVADSGFLLSPHVIDRLAFADLHSPDWKSHQSDQLITQINMQFESTETSPCFDDDFEITFSRLSMDHTDVTRIPGMAQYIFMRSLLQHLQSAPGLPPPQLGEAVDGKIVLQAPARSEFFAPIPPSAKTLTFSFGMNDQSYTGAYRTDGVAFRISAVGQNDVSQSLWTRTLSPSDTPADRGIQTEILNLPPLAATKGLIFETEPGSQNIAPLSYWADLQFR